MMVNKKMIGIIGGSGLEDPKILTNFKEIEIDTPFGKTSSKLTTGMIGDKQVVIMSRHGKNHELAPTQVPYRANIWALKEVGCTHILAATACGSLKEEFHPGDLVFIDQFIDWTKLRKLTFFEDFKDGAKHTPMALPFDFDLRQALIKNAKELGLNYHPTGTMITIEGPRFSTKAESFMFQKLGAEVINMSTVPEVSLANELEIPYQSIAMVTDYDCWKENEESVTHELVMKIMEENAGKVKQLLIKTIEMLD
jgi:5'-methylthioadenosine phosphorylase